MNDQHHLISTDDAVISQTMSTKKEYTIKEGYTQMKIALPRWHRILLLAVLCYEAAGCLLGGGLLLASPDGRYMDMPVDRMHGVFRDFLLPGSILFGLGILNLIAFITVLYKRNSDWIMAGLALGGLFSWFVVEIIILQELHWLHAMWGLPVLLGCVMAIPLIALAHDKAKMRKALLACGILSSLWYVAINIFVPMMYDGYSMASLTVSELSAIGAPTRIIWVLLCLLYPLLFAAFGWGVLQSSSGSRALHIVGTLIILYCIINFYWPPMHQREVIGSGGGTLTDTLHITWAMISLVFMMLLMGFGAAALENKFRVFTLATFVVFIVFGVLIGVESPGIEANLPTPHIGIWERINIGAFMFWVIVFSIALMRRKNVADSN